MLDSADSKTMINFFTKDLKDIKQTIDNLGNIPEAEAAAGEKAILFVHQETPPYPAPPSGSAYRRTGTLGRTITTIQGSGSVDALSRVEQGLFGTRAIVGTALEYAPLVIGKPQAKVHRGRWYILEDVIDGLRSAIMKIYQAEIKRLMKK